jgi:hypothetical protein
MSSNYLHEFIRWYGESWAVDPNKKTIFKIEETEWISDKLIIYGPGISNSSENLETLLECSGIETIRKWLENHFFLAENSNTFVSNNKKNMKEIKVADEYRTNPLSHQPGGDEVRVYLRDGMVYTYDKVKSPRNYINKLEFKENIVRIDINGEKAWSSIEPGVRYWEA